MKDFAWQPAGVDQQYAAACGKIPLLCQLLYAHRHFAGIDNIQRNLRFLIESIDKVC